MPNPLQHIRANHLWSAIEHLADRRGMSLPDLERLANLPSQSAAEASWPSLETIFSALRVMGADLREFGEMVDRIAASL